MRNLIFAIALAAALPAPDVAYAADPVQLKFGFPVPPMSFVNRRGVTPWIKDVEAAAQGTLEIKLFAGPTLGTVHNIYDRTLAGVADLSFGTPGTEGQTFAKTGVSSLPFESDHAYEASLALWRLFEKGVISDEWSEVKVLALFTFSSSGMHSSREIKTADDLKGLKIAAGGKVAADSLAMLGASPVTMTPPETYQSISRGLVNGTNMSWPGVQVFKLFEVANYHLSAPFGLAGAFIAMNKSSYARLPDTARKAIDQYSGEHFARRLGRGGDEEDVAILDQLKKQPGQQFNELSAAERTRWKKILAPVTDKWVKGTPNGAQVLAAFRAEIAAARTGR